MLRGLRHLLPRKRKKRLCVRICLRGFRPFRFGIAAAPLQRQRYNTLMQDLEDFLGVQVVAQLSSMVAL